MATKRLTEAEARSVMAEWEQSGKSGRVFAQEQGVEVQRLYCRKGLSGPVPQDQLPSQIKALFMFVSQWGERGPTSALITQITAEYSAPLLSDGVVSPCNSVIVSPIKAQKVSADRVRVFADEAVLLPWLSSHPCIAVDKQTFLLRASHPTLPGEEVVRPMLGF